MNLSELIVEGIETAGRHATAERLAIRMVKATIGSIVIEDEMKPVGIVTDRDLAIRVDDPRFRVVGDRRRHHVPQSGDLSATAGLVDVTRAM